MTVVTGSIPNNKSDLTRFYEASEFSSVNSHLFLYLSWERANVLGTANMDFEINQKTTTALTSNATGPITLIRTPGDLLVTFDFTNGGGKPTIGSLRWLASATSPSGVPGFSTNVCFSSNSFPCWGDQVTLDGTDSIGAVNNLDAATDPLFPSQPNYQASLPALQFGETAIDLTKANIIPPNQCENFGNAFVKSRASSAFNAEVKDFIAPVPISIQSCTTMLATKPVLTSTGAAVTAPVSPGTSIEDSATVTVTTATGGNAAGPLGSVTFYVCGPTPAATACTTASGTNLGNVSLGSGNSPQTVTSPAVSGSADTVSGFYCFLAQYIPANSFTAKSDSDTTTECFQVLKASPTISTLASPTSGTVGQALTVGDTATFSSDVISPTGSVSFTLYSNASCTVSTGVTGSGPISNRSATFSASFTPSAAGTYYWIASYPGDVNNNPFTTACGAANEQLVIGKATPTITTQASPTSGTVGQALTVGDTATFNNSVNPTGSVTFTLYSDAGCTSSTGVTGSGPISNGSASFSASFTPSAAGTYNWIASYSGDANNNPFTTACGAANEELVIGKVSPSITTQAAPTSGSVGQTLTVGDTATFNNSFNPTGSVTFTLYSDAGCTVSTGVTGSGPISNGSASFSASFTPSQAGTYNWIASYSGDANNNSFTTPCGAANEQLVISSVSPTITTQADPTSGTVGQTLIVGDIATFSSAAVNPTGSVTFTLYSDAGCTLSTGVTGSGPITSNGSPPTFSATFSASFMPTEAGTYNWIASYPGDANNNPFTTACGAANEQLVISPVIATITTQASPTSGSVGQTLSVSDTATFNTSFNPTGSVTFTLYSDAGCTSSTGVTGSGAISNGSATFSASFTPTTAGTYNWIAFYPGDANNNTFTTACGAANEQVVIGPTSPAISTAQSLIPNDTATLSGLVNPTGNVTFNLFSPSDSTCSGTPAFTQIGSLSNNGNGTYSASTSNSGFVVSTTGTWRWQITYPGDANNGSVTSSCGIEQFTIINS